MGEVDIEDFQKTATYLGTIINILQRPESPWWDNSRTAYLESRESVVMESFVSATENLKLYFGRKPRNWQWKKLHIYEAVHPIGRIKPFDLLFNYQPKGLAGGLESPLGFNFTKARTKKIKGGAAVRRIIDFSNPSEFLSVIPGGQSGNVFDKHYKDQYEMFIKGEYRTVNFNSNKKPVSTLKFVK